MNLGYRISPKIHTPALYLIVYVTACVCNITEWVANSDDPDQTPRSAASDLGLHCLLRHACPNTKSKYGNFIKANPSEIITWIRPFL